MSSVQDMVESFFVMVVLVMVGFFILLSLGLPWDIMSPIFKDAGFENVPVTWDTFETRDTMTDMLYGIAYVLFIIGPLQFIYTCVKRQEYDVYNGV